jgi:integrase
MDDYNPLAIACAVAPGRRGRAFEEAAASYIAQGGSARYMDAVIEHFRGRDVATIMPPDIRGPALTMFPHLKASTINRQWITPARAVMLHAHHDLGWCPAIRVRQLKEAKSTKHSAVNGEWMSRFISQADSDGLFHVSAMVFFMQDTAARVSEACNVFGRHVDLRRKEVLLVKTKTDTNALAHLTDECVYRLSHLGMESDKRVFGYSNRWSVNDRIKAICRRAGISYHSSHAVGRHTFATKAIKLGVGVKIAMDAGRWKSSKVFLETYVHVDDAGREVAERFNRQRYANI